MKMRNVQNILNELYTTMFACVNFYIGHLSISQYRLTKSSEWVFNIG
jgi:hypothetical protein